MQWKLTRFAIGSAPSHVKVELSKDRCVESPESILKPGGKATTLEVTLLGLVGCKKYTVMP